MADDALTRKEAEMGRLTREEADPTKVFHWVRVSNKDELEAFYRGVLPAIITAAKEHGYAIGVHGSLRRDLDLIAAPWTEDYSDKDELAQAIHEAALGPVQEKYNWTEKPLGRLASSFPICWTENSDVFQLETNLGNIDLSVMPALALESVREEALMCPITKENCTSVDCIGPKSCRALEEGSHGNEYQLRKALEKMLLYFHDGITPLAYRGKPGAFDCATTAIAEARAALQSPARVAEGRPVDWTKPIQFKNGEPCHVLSIHPEGSPNFPDRTHVIQRDGVEGVTAIWWYNADGKGPKMYKNGEYDIINIPLAPESPAKEQTGEQNADVAAMVKRLRERARELAGSTLITAQDDSRMMFGAAALIEKLGQGWIPVSERLPPKDGTAFLAFFPSRGGYVARQDMQPIYWTGQDWQVSISGHNIYDKFTHWTPLPPPPERP